MFDERVEIRLRGWARWVIDLQNGCEGYPRKSIISLFSDGYGLREEFKSIPLISDGRAQQTGFWLHEMGKMYPQEKEAIFFQYLTTKHPKEIAQALCISRRTYYQRLLAGKIWLSGRINQDENEKT